MKNEKKTKKKIWKKILIFVLVIILLGFLINIGVSLILNNMVKEKVVNEINLHRKSHLKITNVSYNVFLNRVTVTNPEIIFNDSTKSKNDQYILASPSITLTGINWFRLLLSSGFSAGTVSVDSARIELLSDTPKGAEEESNSDKSNESHLISNSVLSKLPNRLNPLIIDDLIINSGLFIGSSKEKNESITDTIKNISLKISGIDLNPGVYKDSLKYVYAEDFSFTTGSVIRRYINSGNILNIDSVSVSGSQSEIAFKKLSFKPFLTQDEYFARRTYRSDRFIIELPFVEIAHVNFKKLFWDKVFEAKNASISNFLVDVLTNKRLPVDPESCCPKMPNDIMRELDFGINLETVKIDKGKILIKSLKTYSIKTAELPITNVEGTIYNLSNSSRSKSDCTIDLSANLADAGKIKVKMNIPLLSQTLNFTYSGSLDSMSVQPINKWLEIEELTRLDEGTIDKVIFTVDVRNGIALVKITPLYHNLSVKLLDMDDWKAKTIPSFIANTFKIRKSNPEIDKQPITANVPYIKNKDDTFLDVVWNAVKKGLGNVVGF